MPPLPSDRRKSKQPPRGYHPKTIALLVQLRGREAKYLCPHCGEGACYHCWECGASLDAEDHRPSCQHYTPPAKVRPGTAARIPRTREAAATPHRPGGVFSQRSGRKGCKACGGTGVASNGSACYPCLMSTEDLA